MHDTSAPPPPPNIAAMVDEGTGGRRLLCHIRVIRHHDEQHLPRDTPREPPLLVDATPSEKEIIRRLPDVSETRVPGLPLIPGLPLGTVKAVAASPEPSRGRPNAPASESVWRISCVKPPKLSRTSTLWERCCTRESFVASMPANTN